MLVVGALGRVSAASRFWVSSSLISVEGVGRRVTRGHHSATTMDRVRLISDAR